MSMHKSSMTMGTPAKKSIDWMKVLDKELVTDLDDMDLVGDAKAWEKCRRLCMTCDAEIWRAEEVHQEAKQKQQAEEVEKCQKEEEVCKMKLTCIIPAGIKKRSACRSCAKAKKRCKWLEVEMSVSRARASPWGGEHKKWAKKVANEDDDDEIIMLSSWKTKWQGGGESLEEITDQQWGELIQAVSTHMDMANGHLEQIASAVQSNSCKMQWHHLLMEGLVGQQQLLVLKLVKMASAAGSGGAKEVAEGQEEPQELQGEELGGQEGETQGVPGGALEGGLEDVPGNELGNGTGAEDGTEEDAQKRDKGKGKEKAL
ncbi:hypothetical protein ID866_11928 [Astraeus odoratus]|nr:hypothetical protein ID866_11928 [Astraeus odoratus]